MNGYLGCTTCVQGNRLAADFFAALARLALGGGVQALEDSPVNGTSTSVRRLTS